jgi:4-hydroxy-2-oxoheptanedioate aldolase
MRKNKIKIKLSNGEAVVVVMGLLTSDIIDFLGPSGIDGFWLECEHGSVTWSQIGDMTRACDLWENSSITRVNANEPWLITRTLDQGSMGVVVPHVNSRAAAEKAVRGTKFAPLGDRGTFGGRQSYGVSNYVNNANDQTLLVVLLEEIEALENLDEILQVDDIDVFFVAPNDLSQTMGYLGNQEHPVVQEKIHQALNKIVKSGRTAGTLVNDNNVDKYIDLGVKFLATSLNGWVMQSAQKFVDNVVDNG